MAIVGGFLDWADQSILGHPEKVYRDRNRAQGIILHSVVGDLPGYAVPDRFLSDDRNPDGSFTPYAAASVMFIVYRDGYIRQLYPVTASPWTSGGYEANTGYWAVELEGGGPNNYSEPITVEAAMTMTRLVQEWSAYTGITGSVSRIFGHREAAKLWNYAPTACPSNRYDWWLTLLFWEGPQKTMTTLEEIFELGNRVARLERLLAGWGGYEVTVAPDNLAVMKAVLGRVPAVGERVRLTGDQILSYLDQMQNNMWLGLANLQRDVAELRQKSTAPVSYSSSSSSAQLRLDGED